MILTKTWRFLWLGDAFFCQLSAVFCTGLAMFHTISACFSHSSAPIIMKIVLSFQLSLVRYSNTGPKSHIAIVMRRDTKVFGYDVPKSGHILIISIAHKIKS